MSRIEDALFATVVARGEKVGVVDGDRTLTFAELRRAAVGLAAELSRRGARPGDRVAMFLDKTLEAVVALYGVWMAGAIAVPINEGLHGRQIRHILDDSGSRLLFSTPRKLAGLERAAVGDVERLAVDLCACAAKGAPRLTEHAGGDTPAIILYTSGSTGRPKGIVVSHANLLAGARIVARYIELREDDRILSVLPFSFDYGLNQLLTVVAEGATLFLLRSHLPADICRALSRCEITGLAGVPTLWIQLMQRQSPLPGQPLPCLRYITNSGGVFPVELVKRYRNVLPATRIYLMYGLSEAFRSTYLPPEELDRRPHSMGRAIPETEILVVDDEGRECGVESVGELVHAGPTVALGYWKQPEATAAVFRDDPRGCGGRVVYSGDLVRRDADGFLTFVGRRDQQIKSYGFRVSPEEVEEAIHGSNLVAEVVALGVPDGVAGMIVVAHIVPRDLERFAAADLIAYCEAELPRYMVPRQVHVHATLPRTSSGKVDRASIGA
ncbi:MAG TPA: AMP-binding protein [Polyangia bacterium]|jgi:acyl-CoA ligase (AMP-forming) (exosortase A-associated)